MVDFAVFRCEVQSVSHLQIGNQMGEALQALFFQQVRASNPALVDELHDKGTHRVRPYAVSDIMSKNSLLRGKVVPSQPAWFQLVGLRNDVVEALYQRLIVAPPAGVEINNTFWVLENVTVERACTINDLTQHYATLKRPERLGVRFLTPTAYKRKGMQVPMPLPTLLFPTLHRRWTEITGLRMSSHLNLFLDYFVSVEDYRLQIEHYRLQGRGVPMRGYVGTIQYGIWQHNDQLVKDTTHHTAARELHEYLREDPTRHDELARALGLLLAFATYAGVGQKTTQGMGMVTLA